MIRMAEESDPLSFEALVGDIIIMSRQVGPRAGEFAQSTHKKPDYHKYPSGKKVIKAICTDRIRCYTKNGKLIDDPVSRPRRDEVETLSITWVIQKNRKNGEIKWYTKDKINPRTCAVEAIINIIERAQSLGQDVDLPFAVYRNKNGQKQYITGNRLTKHIRKIAKKLYPHMSEDELGYFSCHSLRVWTCVLLSEAGKH